MIDGYMGVLQLILMISGVIFYVMFVFHVLFTPDEAKLRRIIREELSELDSEP